MNVWEGPGIKCAREWGSISAPIPCSPEDLELALEGGTNAWPSRAVESHKNVLWDTVLEGGYASGGGLDGCA
jgi:hypothetical protein